VRRPISNVFLMLGAMPTTEWLRNCVALDENGFVRCGAGLTAAWNGDRPPPYALETSRAASSPSAMCAQAPSSVASAVGGLDRGVRHPRGPRRVENPHSRAATTSRITILFTEPARRRSQPQLPGADSPRGEKQASTAQK
jgi:hypothetical protein